jgi:hypothetical protein
MCALLVATTAGLVAIISLDFLVDWFSVPLLANALSDLFMLPAGFLATLVVLETLLDRERRQSWEALLPPVLRVVREHADNAAEEIRGRYDRPGLFTAHGRSRRAHGIGGP